MNKFWFNEAPWCLEALLGGKHQGKGKKQFFPMPMGQVGQYPGSPYPMPQYNPAAETKQEIKITKGLPKRYDCSHSKHGCCWDGRTSAFGPAGKGCPRADKKRIKTCQSSTYNCCWDGKTSAKGPKGEGCPKMKDDPKAKCTMFESECLRNPYYMWTKCRETCIKNLPPIEPFLHGASDVGIPPPACGQPVPGMFPGQGAPGYPYPGMPQGMNGTMGKKTSTKKIRLSKKHPGSGQKS